MAISRISTTELSQLRARLMGDCRAILPGDEHYDAARRAWNLAGLAGWRANTAYRPIASIISKW